MDEVVFYLSIITRNMYIYIYITNAQIEFCLKYFTEKPTNHPPSVFVLPFLSLRFWFYIFIHIFSSLQLDILYFNCNIVIVAVISSVLLTVVVADSTVFFIHYCWPNEFSTVEHIGYGWFENGFRLYAIITIFSHRFAINIIAE